MKKRLNLLVMTVGLIALLTAAQSAFAQNEEDAPEEPELPHHLRPHAQAADQNMLIKIFGDVARAASGQIDVTDLTLVGDGETVGPMDTDTVLSSMMMVYLGFIMVLAGALLVILLVLMSVQASIEGKVLTQRYNEWAVIRTLYAVFAILPAAGGWSIGQFAVLNGTFLVNSVANEMHTVSNRWVFARGTVGSVYLDDYHFRRLAETAYLNEICKVVTNRHYEEQYSRQAAFLDKMQERVASSLPENEVTQSLYSQTMDVFRRATSTTPLEQLTVRRVVEDKRNEESSSSVVVNTGSSGAVQQALRVDYNKIYTRVHWGNEKGGEDVCGQIEVDYGRYLSGTEVKYSVKTLEAYQSAHVKALIEMIKEVESEVKTVSERVYSVLDETDYSLLNGILASEQVDRLEAIANLPDQDSFNALKSYFYPPSDGEHISGESMDKLLAEKVSNYIKTVRTAYNEETKRQAVLFDDLITEIQRRQAAGSTANYLDDIEAAGETLSDDFQGLADDSLGNLIENTKYGWMYAGFKWWDMSRASANAETLANHRPTMSSFRDTLHKHPDLIQERLAKVDATYTKSIRLRSFRAGAPTHPADEESALKQIKDMGKKEASKRLADNTVGWFSSFLFSAVLSDLERGDALMSLQRGGHRLLTTAATFFTAASISSITASALDSGGGWIANLLTGGISEVKGKIFGEIFRGIAKLMTYLAFLCLAVGILYAVYLPLLPAMIWTFAVIGWLEKLVSLIVILPWWMVGHIVPDGDGLVNGVGRQGYVLAANVLARPLVMTLAMSFAMVSLEAITSMVAHFYTSFIPSTHAEYSSGFFVTIGSFVVFSGFVVVVAHMILGWIFKIPDEIPFYLGGPGGNFGEGEAKGHTQSVAGMVFHQTQGTSSLMSGGNKDPNQRSRRGRNAMSKARQSGLGFDKN